MFKVSWNRKAGDLKQSSLIEKDTVNISPHPVCNISLFIMLCLWKTKCRRKRIYTSKQKIRK